MIDRAYHIFDQFTGLIWGKHKHEGNVFLLQRMVHGNNYFEGKGNQQIIMPLDRMRIGKYIQSQATTSDFSISPAIYNGSFRTYGTISGLYCFWVEFDFGQVGHKKHDLLFASKEECIQTLKNNYKNSGLNPNIIMNSGHGIHCYWLVDHNLIEKQTKQQIEKINEWLFQVGIGFNRKFYNEVKSITSLMRSPYPAINRKVESQAVPVKMNFTTQEIYSLREIRNKLAVAIVSKKHLFRKAFLSYSQSIVKKDKTNNRVGCIALIKKDQNFMEWIENSSDLSYYKSSQYYFDSTSAKEAWIFKYLYLCNLDESDTYDFCEENMDRQYHIFRTRKNISDRLKRIQTEIHLAITRNTFPKIKYNHRKLGGSL